MTIPNLQTRAVRGLIERLPPLGFVRSYVERHASNVTDAPMVFHLGAALSALSACLRSESSVNVGGTPLRLNLFVMLLGASGKSRKTKSITLANVVLNHAAEAGQISNVIGAKFGSYAGLMSVLQEMPQCVIFDPEFSGMLAEAQRGRHLESAKRGLLDIYDCTTQTRTLSRERMIAVSPRLTLCVGLAPSLFEYHIEPEDLTGGLLSRFLILFGERDHFRHTTGADSDAILDELAEMLHQRQAFLPPLELTLAGESLAAFNRWEEQVEAYTNTLADEAMVSVATRCGAHALKIAGILSADAYGIGLTTPQIAAKPIRVPIQPDALDVGIQLAAAHAQAAMGILSTLATTPDMRDRRAVLRVLAKRTEERGVVTIGEITRGSNLLVGRVRQILNTLMLEGLAAPMGGATSDGGKPGLPNMFAYVPPMPPISAQHQAAAAASPVTHGTGLPEYSPDAP